MHGPGSRPTLRAILHAARPLLPMLTINDPDTALPNALCVGGSWIAPQVLIEPDDWPAIGALAAALPCESA